jgi:hypothetical protein
MSECAVFISHRKEDRAVAEVLQGALEIFSKFNLDHKARNNVYVCEEMPGGTKWRNWIEEKIASSTIMVFLYTEENADWRWCLYEIGLFNGSRLQGEGKKAHMITLKDPTIERPPPPVDQYQAYNADGAGITKFFKDLCFEGVFTNGEIFNNEFSEMIPQFNDRFEKMVNAFLRPKSETEYLAKRVWFDLNTTNDEQNVSKSIEETLVDGDEEVLQTLSVSKGSKFRILYEQFKNQDQADWLDEIKKAWDDIAQDRRPSGILTPFLIKGKEQYRPVISQIDKHRLVVSDTKSVNPTRLVATLVPCSENSAEGSKASGPLDPTVLFREWSTYLPWSIVRVRWHRKSGNEYAKADINGEPVVCALNKAFTELFDFAYPSPLVTEGASAWTSERLLRQVVTYVLPEHMKALQDDQAKVSQWIIFEERTNYHANIPLQFNDTHPNPVYNNGAFLPCLTAKSIVGNQSGEHETYLLIIYVKQFSCLS